ncbi:MAG: hypothetical protein QM785_07845 [Pyrinomonadaceae bacterium]
MKAKDAETITRRTEITIETISVTRVRRAVKNAAAQPAEVSDEVVISAEYRGSLIGKDRVEMIDGVELSN